MIDGGELQSESETSRTEAEIEASKTHWSEVAPAVSQTGHSGKTNREYIEVLKRRKYVREGNRIVAKQIAEYEKAFRLSLFDEYWGKGLVVGEKLAEGGQAEIYAASKLDVDAPLVVKVFKGGSVLQHLEKQIPLALLKLEQWDDYNVQYPPRGTFGATLLTEERFKERFASVMDRSSGDLRKLIEQQMMHSSLNAGPPFSSEQVLHLMWNIAGNMENLHRQHPPILHNDLKGSKCSCTA